MFNVVFVDFQFKLMKRYPSITRVQAMELLTNQGVGIDQYLFNFKKSNRTKLNVD